MFPTSELRAIVGAEHVEAPPPAAYLHDATITRGLRGEAAAVVRPADAEEVRRVFAWCYEHDLPIVPRGGGSGLAGGAVPLDGRAVVLSLERLTRVRSFEPELWRVDVGGGGVPPAGGRPPRGDGVWVPPPPRAAPEARSGGDRGAEAGGGGALWG